MNITKTLFVLVRYKSMGLRILAVEDSEQYQLMIKTALLSESMDVVTCSSAKEALEKIESSNFDLFILDIGLPDMSGLQICEYLRSHSLHHSSPIIFLTGKDALEDKEVGYSSGADDYITKPFNLRELSLRVQALLKLTNRQSAPVTVFGSLKIDTEAHKVSVIHSEQMISLTRKEYDLLSLFHRLQGQLVSRERILNAVWPDQLETSERTIDSHISNLRKKIAGHGILIQAVHGSGYRAEVTADSKAA